MQDSQQTAAAAPAEFDAALELARGLMDRAIAFLPSVVGALAVFLIGMWIAGRVRVLVKKWFARSNRLDETLESFLSSLAYYIAVTLVVITTLGVFGVQTTSLAAVVGAAGLAVGLALQGTLGHIASGVMLLMFRPFQLGDYIEAAGHEGSVKALTLFTTELATVDNKKVIIPNGEIWAGSIVNFSAYDTRRVDLVFGVAYGEDLEKAQSIIARIANADTRILKDPATVIAVDNLGESSVDIICRVWVARADYFPVKWDMTQKVKEALDAEGVSIPFPTRTIINEAA